MLIGSVSEEGMRLQFAIRREAEWHATLTAALGEGKATELIGRHEEGASGKSHSDIVLWRSRLERAQQCATHGETEVRTRRSAGLPILVYLAIANVGRRRGAWHTAELAFCFDNTKRCEQGTGNTPQAQELATRMSTAWANFAATGNPNQPGLPWTPSDPTRVQTMIFDNDCGMADDPERDVRKILLS